MIVELKRSWKNHPAGSRFDVSDGVHDDLIRLGVLEEEQKPAPTPAGPKPKASSFRRPPRDKMIKSPVGDK